MQPENGACFPAPPSLRAFGFCLRLCRPVLWRQRLSRETSTEKAQKLAETSREIRNTVLLNLTVFLSGSGDQNRGAQKKAQTRKHEHKKKHQKKHKKTHKLGNTSTKKSTRKSTRKKHKLVNTLAVKSTRKAQKNTNSSQKAPEKTQNLTNNLDQIKVKGFPFKLVFPPRASVAWPGPKPHLTALGLAWARPPPQPGFLSAAAGSTLAVAQEGPLFSEIFAIIFFLI